MDYGTELTNSISESCRTRTMKKCPTLKLSQFPKMFSASQRCRVPNVNIDNMRNGIFGANVLERHNITSGKELFDWILVQNAALGAKYEHDEERQNIIKAAAWNKASRNGFYLGLETSWLFV